MQYKKLKNELSKDVLLTIYPTNSDSMICEQFGIKKVYQLVKLLNEYGIERHTKIENTQLTCMNKYGVKSIASLDSTKNKIKQTNIEKYGVMCYLETKESQEKAHQAIVEKYNVDNIFQLDSIKEKSRNTKIDKYDNPNFVNPEKTKETKLKKYGDETYTNINKRIETSLNKYGVPHAMKNEEVVNKLKATTQERYSVDFYCLTDDCRQSLVHKNDSKPNKNFSDMLIKYNIKFEREYHLFNLFYDFKIGNTLIEINPSATHNSTWGLYSRDPISKDYHKNKTDLASKNGFRCICVWDWDDKDKIINLLKNRDRIYARNCTIRLITKYESKDFINKYHIQNDAKASIFIGLFNNDELVSVMTFDKPRYNKKYEYELVRYCSSKDVIGGAEKLFKFFIREYNPKSIISYCDLSKFNGNTYYKLGFKLNKITIGKHWYNIKTKQHITDNLLRQRGFDQLFKTNFGKGTSNNELMLNAGFVEIYDCGQATFILNL